MCHAISGTHLYGQSFLVYLKFKCNQASYFMVFSLLNLSSLLVGGYPVIAIANLNESSAFQSAAPELLCLLSL